MAPSPDPGPGGATTTAQIAVLGVAPSVVELVLHHGGTGATWALGALGVATAIGARATRLGALRFAAPPVAFVLGALLLSDIGTAPVLGATATVLLLCIGTDHAGASPSRRVPPTVALVAGILGVAWMRAGSRTVLVAGLLVLAVVVVLHAAGIGRLHRLDRALEVAVDGIVAAVGVLVTLIVAGVALYLPYLPWRLWRRWGRRSTRSGWTERSTGPGADVVHAGRPFVPEARSTVARRWAIGVVASVVVAVLAVMLDSSPPDPATPGTASARATPTERPRPGSSTTDTTTPPPVRDPGFRLGGTAAFAEVPWADDIQIDHENMQPTQRVGEIGVGDVHTRFVDVDRGVRRSLTGQCPGCPSVRVWWFGGSAAFGWFLRNDHTIPSVLVRSAAADGIDLRIENRAVAGWTIWQEAQYFTALASMSPERPDLALFYDGFNDVLGSAAAANQRGRLAEPAEPTYVQLDQLGPLRDPALRFDDLGGPTTLGRHEARRYSGIARSVQAVGREHGVEVRFVLQPDAFAARRHLPDISGSLGVDGREFADSDLVRTFAAFEDGVTPEVLNLRHALDRVTEPVFPDTVHPNERGAEAVGRELYRALRPRLEELAR